MKGFVLMGRYGLQYPVTYIEDKNCFYLDTSQATYVSIHGDIKDIDAIDPEGLYIISKGSKFGGSTITKIEPSVHGYNIYIE